MNHALTMTAIAVLTACTLGSAPVSCANAQPAAEARQSTKTGNNVALAKFFADYDAQELSFHPEAKTKRGIRDTDYGDWDDPSDAAKIAEIKRMQAAVARMEAEFGKQELNEADQLSYRLFQIQAEQAANAFEFRRNVYIFNQMNGMQSQLPAFLINMHRVTDKADAEAYVSRLNGMGPLFDALVAQSAERAKTGVIAPAWVYPYVIEDAQNIISGAPFEDGADSPLYADLKQKVNALAIPAAEKAELIAGGATALRQQLKPAYEKLIAEMRRQQKIAPQEDGVWRFEDGEDYYSERLDFYTTTALDATEIHQIGLDNVARIHNEMRKILKRVGFKGSLQDFFNQVRTDEAFFFKSREAYLAVADEKLAAMDAALPKFFDTLPKAPLVVKPVEAFREKSAGKAFYQRPTPDGSRPGVYYVNLYDLNDMSSTELEALAYHEGVPGHHLQLAIQTELSGVPAFRKFASVTAYSEGWGLYSEELGKDMGFYTDPYSDFGRLGMELWRACRLVVDTGLHDMRWSREEAIAYLTENTPNPEGDIRKAIERYIVYPGQATAYMIGKLKIVELRERAQTSLGDAFSIGAFHDVILKSGPVPLNIMEQRVDEWIAGNL
ncbi:MAG: DUF885 domain-containing protein [Pseudomonadales bacterium]|nr:DUF885 domain-containing protein [Pseudomonadales bacterium]